MVVGYCRTSKTSQELALQKDALEKYGVDHIYTERMSGVKQRPVLEGVLSELNAGDTLVVWKLDRLGRYQLRKYYGAIRHHHAHR